MLKSECDRARATWRLACAVDAVRHDAIGFAISTSQGALRASSLVVATGGLTVPKIGATPFAYRLAESTKGRVFFTAGRDLDRYVVWDYVKRKREIVA